MSDKKQVIHVKELIIKADRVVIEQKSQHKRDHDPFFNRPTSRSSEGEKKARTDKKDRRREEDDQKGKDDRRPFSWF